MQRLHHTQSGLTRILELPDPNEYVLPGVRWGRLDQVFTPASWKAQSWMAGLSDSRHSFRLGQTLEEEAVACLLCGYGVPSEVGLAAFQRLRNEGLIRLPGPQPSQIERQLRRPLQVGERMVRYRFAVQKSQYIASALQALHETRPDTVSGQAFRAWFLKVRGVGPKTASFITRNWLGSDEVAILDIHVLRALFLAGATRLDSITTTSYFIVEECFLNFSAAIGERPSVLDAVIWRQMRLAGDVVQRGMSSQSNELSPTLLRQVA